MTDEPTMSETLSARARAAAEAADEERKRRRRESAERSERERQERAEQYYRDHVAPVLSERLGTDPDEWTIAHYEPGLANSESMTVEHRDEPLALCVFYRAQHVRLAHQGDDGKWRAWNSGPLIRSLVDLGEALREWERRNDAVEVATDV